MPANTNFNEFANLGPGWAVLPSLLQLVQPGHPLVDKAGQQVGQLEDGKAEEQAQVAANLG